MRLGRQIRLKFDSADKSALPNFLHPGQMFHRLEFPVHLLDFRMQIREHIIAFEDFETRLCRRAAECIPGVTVAVSECLSVNDRTVEARENLFGHERDREWKVATG